MALKPTTIQAMAIYALILAVPGPLLVLLAYVIYHPSIAPALWMCGIWVGLVLNGPALLLGLCSCWRWEGLEAVVISGCWWAWICWLLNQPW
jgi:hypothetical protein